MIMKIAIVVNPCSGGSRPKKLLPRVKQKLEQAGIGHDIFISRHSRHIQQIAQNLDIRQFDAIVAMGGDGTNFHMINGLLSCHRAEDLPPLGILPAGSGNSFVRDLGIFHLDQAIDAILRNTPKPVDLISFSGPARSFFFVNLMGLGFVTHVAETAQHFKALHDLSYLIGVAWQTLFLDPGVMEIEIDGKLYAGDYTFVEFCNSRFTGGNMLMAPEARIDDGLMDIILARSLSRTTLLASLPKLFKGTHLDMDQITCIKARQARIISRERAFTLLPDGEILGKTPGTLEVMPGALRYFV